MTVSLEDTRVYHDIVRETKLKIIQCLLMRGFELEVIADAVKMPISEVQEVARVVDLRPTSKLVQQQAE